MYARQFCVLALTSALCCACEDAPVAEPSVTIAVAPLSLPNVVGVEYALAVFNAAPPTGAGVIFDVSGAVLPANDPILVWQNDSVTSTLFGNGGGGDISYVGPCDASVASGDNWVALALKKVAVAANQGSYSGIAPWSGAYAGTMNLLDDELSAFADNTLALGPGSNDLDPDFVNPSDFADPLVMKFACDENADTEVVFNLTIMRDAEQGFFDVAVNFEDVFCSMKVDTCYDDDLPIMLLFDREGERVETAVVASACTAGPGADGETLMWMSPLTISCDQKSFDIDPTGYDLDPLRDGKPGNHCVSVQKPASVSGGTKSHGKLFFYALEGDPLPFTVPAGTIVTEPGIGGLSYVTTTSGTVTQPGLNANGAIVDAEATAPGFAYHFGSSGVVYFDIVVGGQTVHALTYVEFSGGTDGTPVPASDHQVCYALYWGEEQLLCGAPPVPCNKEYWNVAINLDDLVRAGLTGCEVTTAISASSAPGPFLNGSLPGPGQTHGYVAIDAGLTEGTPSGPSCLQGPMGSDYAPVEYGTSADMIGGDAFPQLCSRFVLGDDRPRRLKDVGGYFHDLHTSKETALEAGSIDAETNAGGAVVRTRSVELSFADMGALIGEACGSGVYNLIEASAFGVAGHASMQTIAWTGGGELGGTYDAAIFGRAGGVWSSVGAFAIDLTNDVGRAQFQAGGTFQRAGFEAFAIVLTRTDTGNVPQALRLVVGWVTLAN